MIEDEDGVGVLHGAEAVGDRHAGAALTGLVQGLLDNLVFKRINIQLRFVTAIVSVAFVKKQPLISFLGILVT